MGTCNKCGLIDGLCRCRFGSSSLSSSSSIIDRLNSRKDRFTFDSSKEIEPLEIKPLKETPVFKQVEINSSLLSPWNPGQCDVGNLEIKPFTHVGPRGDHGDPYPSPNLPTELIRNGPGPNVLGWSHLRTFGLWKILTGECRSAAQAR